MSEVGLLVGNSYHTGQTFLGGQDASYSYTRIVLAIQRLAQLLHSFKFCQLVASADMGQWRS